MNKTKENLKRNFKNLNIKYKLFTAFLVVVLIPFLIYVTAVNRLTDNLVFSNLYYSAEQNFDQAYTFLSYKFKTMCIYIRTLAYNEQIIGISSGKGDNSEYSLNAQLADMETLRAGLSNYTKMEDILGAKLYVSSGLIYSNENISIFNIAGIKEKQWFKNMEKVKLGYFYLSSEQLGEENTLTIAKCILNANDYSQVAGILRIDFNKNDIVNLLSKANALDTGVTLLYNENEEPVACSDLDLFHKYGVSIGEIKTHAEGAQFTKIMHDNKAFLLRSKKIKDSEWHMATILPEYELINSVRTQYGVIVGGLVMVILISILFTYAITYTITRMKAAELKALQAQINPHFLYNTLDMINWMAKKQDAEGVTEAIRSLSKLYKIGLSKGSEMISIQEELVHVTSYFNIQNMRFDNRLKLETELCDDLSDVKIPKLILQPIVENSILHGILEKDSKEGTISVRICKEKKFVKIDVRDDGVGMDDEKLSTILTEGKSYGLINIEARLKLMNSKNSLCFKSVKNEYTLVSARIYM